MMKETSYEYILIDLSKDERNFLKILFPSQKQDNTDVDGVISRKLSELSEGKEAQIWSEDELARATSRIYEMAKFLINYKYDANQIDGQQNVGTLLHVINSLADDIVSAWEKAIELRRAMETEDLLNLRDNLARLCQEYNDGKMAPKDFTSDYDAYIEGMIY